MEPTASANISATEHNINTNADERDVISTHVLPIDTHGNKSRQDEVLERLLKQQPVYDKSGQLTAVEYSLRIRVNQSDDTTLIAGLLSLTEDGKHPRHPLLISIGTTAWLSDDIDHLPPQHVIFALDIEPTDLAPLIPKLKQRIKNGYRVLLNYHYEAIIPPALSGLIKQARLDVGLLNATELEIATSTLREHGMQTLIACNLRCQETLDLCNRLKFDEFQGSYFDYGPALTPKPSEINRLSLLELMDRVIARHDLTSLEPLIKFDARLCYQLIAYTNTLDSDATINSLTQAIQLLKHDGLYRWLTLLLHTSLEPSAETQILLKRGLSRAFFLETLARKSLQHTDPQAMYLVGLLSIMNELTGLTFDRLIAPLKLTTEIKQALLENKGNGGLMLKLAVAAENGEQAKIEDYAARCLINSVEVNLAMINALVMAETIQL